MRGHVNRHAGELSTFAFEQAALLAAIWFAGQKPASCSYDAVPWDALSCGAAGDSVTGRARSAGQMKHLRKLAVSNHTAARDAFYKVVDFVPATCIFCHVMLDLSAEVIGLSMSGNGSV